MADGYGWHDMDGALRGPGVEIRRVDHGGLAQCMIRLAAGVRTDVLFAGLPNDRCQCAHWGYIISGRMRVHYANDTKSYDSGEVYYWPPGHNLESLVDIEYLEISKSADYDTLMGHCRRKLNE